MNESVINKLPQITLAFWIMKICATTLGETAGDLFSMTLGIGYAVSSMVLIGIFFATLVTQLVSQKHRPFLYWTVILSTSTAGTTMSDYMDRTLGLGYADGSVVLITILVAVFSYWKWTGLPFSMSEIKSLKGETLYWTAILFSNTLGTAFGDYLADSSGLGFEGGALLVGSLIVFTVLARKFTKIPSVALFWIAFVLTRPFGATVGDLLTKTPAKGWLGFGTVGSSAVLLIALVVLVAYETWKKKETANEIEPVLSGREIES